VVLDDTGIDPSKVVTFKTKDEVNEFRKKMTIKVTGDDVPDPTPTFPSMIEKSPYFPIFLNVLTKKWSR
jgi:hypothetical protein